MSNIIHDGTLLKTAATQGAVVMDKFELRDCEIKATGANNRVLKFVGSTAMRDRYGDEVAVEGWDTKNYKRNPVFLWAHRRDLLPIGRAVNVVQDGEKLKFDIEFAPADINEFAEQVFQHYQQGFLKGVSVGFQSHKSERFDETSEEELKRRKTKPDVWPGKKFLKQELLELSACPVGANPEALIMNKALESEPTNDERRAFDVWLTDTHEDTQSLEAPENCAENRESVEDALADACEEEIPEVTDETEKTTEEATAPTLDDVLTALTRFDARFADLEKKIDGLTTKTAPREPLSDAQADDAAAGEGAKDAGDDAGTADGDSDTDVEIVECSDDLIELDLGAEEDDSTEESLYESVFEH